MHPVGTLLYLIATKWSKDSGSHAVGCSLTFPVKAYPCIVLAPPNPKAADLIQRANYHVAAAGFEYVWSQSGVPPLLLLPPVDGKAPPDWMPPTSNKAQHKALYDAVRSLPSHQTIKKPGEPITVQAIHDLLKAMAPTLRLDQVNELFPSGDAAQPRSIAATETVETAPRVRIGVPGAQQQVPASGSREQTQGEPPFAVHVDAAQEAKIGAYSTLVTLFPMKDREDRANVLKTLTLPLNRDAFDAFGSEVTAVRLSTSKTSMSAAAWLGYWESMLTSEAARSQLKTALLQFYETDIAKQSDGSLKPDLRSRSPDRRGDRGKDRGGHGRHSASAAAGAGGHGTGTHRSTAGDAHREPSPVLRR